MINWHKTKIPAAIKENMFSLTMISLVAATDEDSHQPHSHSTQHTHKAQKHMDFYSGVGSPVTDPDQSYQLLCQRV